MKTRPSRGKRLNAQAGLVCLLVVLFGCTKTPGAYQAGTYTASAAGYGGALRVEVKFDRNAILSIAVTEEHETKEFGPLAIGVLPGRMVAAQTYDVEAVSSATLTSEAIKAAVKDCVEQAALKKPAVDQ
jgi:fumarate reductase flavoprotein subunit